jgi:hypothetical protein
MADPCLHEKDWGRIIEMVESQHKEIYGNGKPGLTHEVAELSVKMEIMNQSVKDLSTNISALMKFENQFTGAEKANDKTLTNWVKVGGFVIAIMMAYFAYSNSATRNMYSRLEKKLDYVSSPFNYRGGHVNDSIQ